MKSAMSIVSRTALLAGMMCAAPAFAQDAAAPASPATTTAQPETDGTQLGEIVVTARKIAENLQTVPIAVTAFSGDQLRQQSAVRIQDVGQLTPSLYVKDANATGAAVTFTIRGQVQGDILATLDPSVGVYVDGYYWARAYGINANLLDIQSFQTLKGPQGTLFGRNTTGGAIVLQTNNPNFNGISGSASATYGRFNERSGEAILNLPIVADRIAIRGAFQMQKRDGYVTNALTTLRAAQTGPTPGTFRGGTSGGGKDLGNINNYTGRVKLLGQVTDNLSILLSAEFFRTKFLNAPFRLSYAAQGITAGTNGFNPNMEAANDLGVTVAQGRDFLQNYIASAKGDTVSVFALPETYAKTRTYTSTTNLDTFFGAIKFITGIRHVVASSGEDLTGAPIRLLSTIGTQNLSQFSGELQITGKAFDDAIDFAGGAYYFSEKGHDGSMSPSFLSFNPSTNIFDGHINTKSQGLYGQATWHITDHLNFTGGLRYSVEDKGIVSKNRSFNRGTGLTTCTLVGATLANFCALQAKDAFDGISYTAGLDYKFDNGILLYAKSGRGFRSGGQNLRAAGGLSAFQPFQPETADQQEVGIKSEFLDRRVRLNVSGYYTKVSDLQRSTIVTTATTSATIVGNAGKARIVGGEAELNAVLFEGFVVGGTAALTKFKYLNYIDPNTGADRRNERIESIPKWTYTISASYNHQFDSVKASARVDYIWTGDVNLAPYNNNGSFGSAVNPDNALITDVSTAYANTVINARAALGFADDTIEVAVFGRNLTSSRTKTTVLFFAPPTALSSYQRRAPRTFGVTGTFKFGSN